jgi:hypothetical protein
MPVPAGCLERLELVKPEPPLRGARGQRLLGEHAAGLVGAQRSDASTASQGTFAVPSRFVPVQSSLAVHMRLTTALP